LARPTAWTCPNCLRSVPGRVEVCYCGTTREAAERVRPAEPPEAGRPWPALALAAAAVAVVAVALLRGGAIPEPAPTPSPAPVAATPAPLRTPPRLGEPTPGRRIQGRVPDPTPEPPLSPTLPPETPAPEPTPEPTPEEDSVDLRREQGQAELEAGLEDLRRKLDNATRRLDSYRNACRSSTSAVRPPGCDGAESEIRRLVTEVAQGVRAAELQARRAWVPPGTQRELLRGRGLDGESLRRLEAELDEAFR
jgi:hypothetical protein